jgi:hypothetical protein
MSGTFGSKPALTAPKYHFRYPRLNATSLPIADGHQSGWRVQIAFVLMSVENIGLFGMAIALLTALASRFDLEGLSRDDAINIQTTKGRSASTSVNCLLIAASRRKRRGLPYWTLR